MYMTVKQAAFLGSETGKQLLGYNFTKAEDRTAYIGKLLDFLFEGSGICFSDFFRHIYSHHIISLFCTSNDCSAK